MNLSLAPCVTGYVTVYKVLLIAKEVLFDGKEIT